ncbi:MAG: Gfo/Idh/MocA family protein [Myxococcota bacterium]
MIPKVIPELPELELDGSGDPGEAGLSSPPPELAVVCLPVAERARVLSDLLRTGVDTLVMAPLAHSRAAAVAVSELAERLGRTLVTAAPMRRFTAARRARDLIGAGAIGALDGVQIRLARKRTLAGCWQANPLRSGGGIWIDRGPDALDLAEQLAGPIERVWIAVARSRQRTAVEDEVRVELEHAGGVRSTVELSWNDEAPEALVRCRGPHGELRIGHAQSVLVRAAERRVFAGSLSRHEISRALLEDLLRRRACRDPEEDHGEMTLGWIEAGYRSLRSGRWEIA